MWLFRHGVGLDIAVFSDCLLRHLLFSVKESNKLTLVCRESDITKERIQKILSSGANVVLTTGGIDDMCLKYFVDVGAMAVRRVLKRDLKRIAKATGGRTRCHSNQNY